MFKFEISHTLRLHNNKLCLAYIIFFYYLHRSGLSFTVHCSDVSPIHDFLTTILHRGLKNCVFFQPIYLFQILFGLCNPFSIGTFIFLHFLSFSFYSICSFLQDTIFTCNELASRTSKELNSPPLCLTPKS